MKQSGRTLGLVLAGWLLVGTVAPAQTQTIQEALEQILQLKKQLAQEKARAEEMAALAHVQAEQARRAELEARRQAEIALQAAKEAEARARQQQQQNQGQPQPVPIEVDRLRRELEETRRALEESRREAERLADRLRQVEAERVRGGEMQNRELLERMMQLERRMMEMERRMRLQPGAPLERPREKPPEDPDGVKIEGQVTKMSGAILQLSVGSDSGLKKNQTLELFRLGTNPLYLGKVRITDVEARAAVAMPVGKLVEEARVGDQVSSSLLK